MTAHRLAAGAAILLVVLAGCSAPIGSSPAASQSTPAAEGTSGPTVSVSATGQVEADPDLAIVRVAVTARAPSADDARRTVADDADRMRSALEDLLPDGSVRTASFSISPEYDDRNPSGERELAGYHAVHAFRIEVAGVDGAGEVVDVAVANGADRVDGVEFTLSEERRSELRTQALGRAMDSARSDADVLADAAGLSVTGVLSVSTADSGVIPFYADTERAGGGTAFQPGSVTVSAHVDAVYGLA